MKLPLSVVVPTYNEAGNIEDCLKSVAWAGEIILVDGGSQDETIRLARPYTSKMIETQNAPAETQRQKAVAAVSHPWFLFLDADERVSSGLKEQIQAVLESLAPASAYYVLRRNLFRNRPLHMHHPDYQLRLFRKDAVLSLPDRIHRKPEINGTLGHLDGELDHYFFTSVEDHIQKMNRYTTIEASYLRQNGKTVPFGKVLSYATARPIGRFIQNYLLGKGYRDGFFGLFYSLSSAYYEFAIAARLILESR